MFKIALVLFTAFFLSSCSNDESDNVTSDLRGENSGDGSQAQDYSSSLALEDSLQRNVSSREVPKPVTVKFSLKTEVNCRIFKTVLIDDGTLYTDCGGAEPGAIIAVDEQSGAEKWRFSSGEELIANPNPVGDIVYAASDHYLYALDAYTGTEKWSFLYLEEGELTSSIRPFAADEQAAYIQDSMGVFHAFAAATGEELWQVDMCSNAKALLTVVAGDYLFISRSCINIFDDENYEMDTGIIVLDKNTGEEQWTYTSDSLARMGFVVKDGTIFVVDVGSLIADSYSTAPTERLASSVCAIDVRSGKEKWCFNKGDEILGNGLAVTNGVVVVGSDFDVPLGTGFDKTESRVYALDAMTGEEKWSFDTEGKLETEIFIAGSAAIFGSVVNPVNPPLADGTKVITHTYSKDLQTGEHNFMIFNEEGQGHEFGLPPLKFIMDGELLFLTKADESARLYTVE